MAQSEHKLKQLEAKVENLQFNHAARFKEEKESFVGKNKELKDSIKKKNSIISLLSATTKLRTI